MSPGYFLFSHRVTSSTSPPMCFIGSNMFKNLVFSSLNSEQRPRDKRQKAKTGKVLRVWVRLPTVAACGGVFFFTVLVLCQNNILDLSLRSLQTCAMCVSERHPVYIISCMGFKRVINRSLKTAKKQCSKKKKSVSPLCI